MKSSGKERSLGGGETDSEVIGKVVRIIKVAKVPVEVGTTSERLGNCILSPKVKLRLLLLSVYLVVLCKSLKDINIGSSTVSHSRAHAHAHAALFVYHSRNTCKVESYYSCPQSQDSTSHQQLPPSRRDSFFCQFVSVSRHRRKLQSLMPSPRSAFAAETSIRRRSGSDQSLH